MTRASTSPFDLAISQFGLGLALELGLRELDADHPHKPFPDIFTRQVLLDPFEKIGIGRVLVDRPGEGGLKSDQMGSSLVGIDIVGKGEQDLAIPIIVLEGNLDFETILLPLDIDRFGMETVLILVQVFDEGDDPALIKKVVPFFRRSSSMLMERPLLRKANSLRRWESISKLKVVVSKISPSGLNRT